MRLKHETSRALNQIRDSTLLSKEMKAFTYIKNWMERYMNRHEGYYGHICSCETCISIRRTIIESEKLLIRE